MHAYDWSAGQLPGRAAIALCVMVRNRSIERSGFLLRDERVCRDIFGITQEGRLLFHSAQGGRRIFSPPAHCGRFCRWRWLLGLQPAAPGPHRGHPAGISLENMNPHAAAIERIAAIGRDFGARGQWTLSSLCFALAASNHALKCGTVMVRTRPIRARPLPSENAFS